MDFRQPREENEKKRFPDGFRILQGKQEYVTYSEHSSIRIWPSDQATHYDYHQHSAVEIILPHRGVSVYRLPERIYCVEPGQILIIPSDVPHELTESKDTMRYLMLFEPGPMMSLRDQPSIQQVLRDPIYLNDGTELQSRVAGLLNQVVTCYFEKEPMWNARCYSYLLQIYALLGTELQASRKDGEEDNGPRIDSEIMNGALTYINQHYMEELSLEQVASFAGFSKFYFSRVFKQFSGCSFTEYLTRKRMNVATDLLVRTSQSIREIAESSGFGSLATFNRVFRKHNQCTPSQYRAIYGRSMYTGGARWLFPKQEEEAEES